MVVRLKFSWHAYLAGLWANLVAGEAGGAHLFKGLQGMLDEATKREEWKGH